MMRPGRKMQSLDIGQEGHGFFAGEFYLNPQSDMEKYVIEKQRLCYLWSHHVHYWIDTGSCHPSTGIRHLTNPAA
jgi:hypothetical protein